MELYYLILLNSFQSSFIVSFYSETAWFAALYFGGINMALATAAAVLGSTASTSLNFLMGSYLAWKRDDWMALSEKTYQRFSGYTRYTVYLLLLPVSGIPAIGIFWGIYVLLLGFFRAPVLKSLLLIAIGRVLYYSYYLMQP